MELRDLLLTPIYLGLFTFLALLLRPLVTDRYTRKYFLPGLGVKIVGALAVGFIYQFYYSGGDTFAYYHDASLVWKAFLDSPLKAFRLITASGEYLPGTFDYASQMYFFHDASSYAVVRFAGLFSLFSFNTYAVIACIFAVLSYSGLWALYLTFYRLYPHLYRPLAWAVLFIPSVFFWGSGLLKDTLTLAAVGWATYAVYKIFFRREYVWWFSVVLILSCWVIYSIKIYILLCFLPAVILWVFLSRLKKIKSAAVKLVTGPLVIVVAAGLGYLAIIEIGEESHRYNIDTFSYTAESTARWLTYVGQQQGGSVYTLGDFDYSPVGMLKKTPLAINVTLFRPYLWEVDNPVMLLAALESFGLLFFTLYVFYKRGVGSTFKAIAGSPFLIFCFIFSISFAFAVGIATYNFGSLVRYKIPLLPFYVAALVVLLPAKPAKRSKKLPAFASTEKRPVTV
ncbi:hypothetical protein [Nafulsella turpanensis]|uniref:hypothetical protein n=1 Tax=Nafulsella turpanensis TaxID=1265690 RepID=UPI0012682F61|nr:hypothetical protein [Nafulsella turpanensis]